jgi:hypothetical protein
MLYFTTSVAVVTWLVLPLVAVMVRLNDPAGVPDAFVVVTTPDEPPPPPQPMLTSNKAKPGAERTSRRPRVSLRNNKSIRLANANPSHEGGFGEFCGTSEAEPRAVVVTLTCTVVPLEAGVAGFGDTLQVAAAGAPVHENVTG